MIEADAGPVGADVLASVERRIGEHLRYTLGKNPAEATVGDAYTSLAHALRDLAVDRLLSTEARYAADDLKTVSYLSMEYLLGRSMTNNLINLGVYEVCRDAIGRLGYDMDEVRAVEADPALGNGGLGRLAACFLDSMATLGVPGYGYGINYEYGLFRQEFQNGYQVEQPDQWLAFGGSPWEMERADERVVIPVGGRVVDGYDGVAEYKPHWTEWQTLVGVPYDMPVVGYGGRTVNRLRLYAARASSEFNIQIFNAGDYTRAVEQKIASETVSKICYPSDSVRAGQALRLRQEYFLVACSLRDIIDRYKARGRTMDALPAKVAIQLNDTHPALAVAELMRILVDEERLAWDHAWRLAERTIAFTNHTMLPEALETWPSSLMAEVAPRHLQIIYEINRRFLERARIVLHEPAAVERVSIIGEGREQTVRMANLAVVGSHSVNGVAAIHTRLLRETLFADFDRLWPGKFNNKTNGITPRRWLLQANPRLATAVADRLGAGWITDLDQLDALTAYAGDGGFADELRRIKAENKAALAGLIAETLGVVVDPDSLFDIQAKRIHEYKRQLLNALHIIHCYLALLDEPEMEFTPRTFVFAGKAAPGYQMAKLIIKLINSVAETVNSDRRLRDRLRVAFLPDYRVTLAEALVPAADLSEQISTAGKEASGTGNMKFALNGALTVGTLDGANAEILEAVGAENIYIFGLTVEEIAELRERRGYHPRGLAHGDENIRRVLDALRSDRFAPGEPGLFQPIIDALTDRGDEYFVLADFEAYRETQARIGRDFLDADGWTARAIRNIAGMGRFSSDRAVREYARDIWDVPVPARPAGPRPQGRGTVRLARTGQPPPAAESAAGS